MDYKKLTDYILEAVKRDGTLKITDCETITYPDGTTIKVADLEEKVQLCIMTVISKFPFFAPAIKALIPIFTNALDTMATDGVRLFMNPRFTNGLSYDECVFVFLHECMHNILNHISRERSHGCNDHTKANIAADYEVNWLLEDGNIVKKGTTEKLGGMIDPKYAGMPFEKIFDSMGSESPNKPKSQQQPNGQQGGQGQSGNGGQGQSGNGGQGQSGNGGQGQSGNGTPGGAADSSAAGQAQSSEVGKVGGGFIDPKLGDKIAEEAGYSAADAKCGQSTTDVDNTWKKIGEEVAARLRGSGRGAGLLDAIDNINKANFNWKRELRKIIGNAVGGVQMDSKWGRKRDLALTGEIRRFDKQRDTDLSDIIFMVDTSGSNHGFLPILLSESAQVLKQKSVEYVTYVPYGIQCEDVITSKTRRFDIKELHLRDGGGTNLERSFKQFADGWDARKMTIGGVEHKIHRNSGKCQAMIVFTDGEDDFRWFASNKPRWVKHLIFVVAYDKRKPTEPKCLEDNYKVLYIDQNDIK